MATSCPDGLFAPDSHGNQSTLVVAHVDCVLRKWWMAGTSSSALSVLIIKCDIAQALLALKSTIIGLFAAAVTRAG